MKLSVHQPQYLPWIGYLNKISESDMFIFLDNVQYKKREFQNRNKILTKTGPLWLTVPVKTKGKFDQLIREVEIENADNNWRRDHFESIRSNYCKAPFFKEHEEFLSTLYAKDWPLLSDLSVYITMYIISYLELPVKIEFESKLGVPGMRTERIINLCKKTNASIYLSGQGAKDYLDEARFKDEGIGLEYQQFAHPVYQQLLPGFVSHLTVFDLLMNKGKESISIIKNAKQQEPV